MPSTREITRTEQRIAEIDALQQTIEQLQQDLQLYREALRRELELLQQEVAAPAAGGLETVEDVAPVESAPADPSQLDEEALRNLDEEAFADLGSIGSPQGTAKSDRSPFELEEMEPGSEKVGGKPVSVLISDGTLSEEPLPGWVMDRPPGGLKILVDDEIKIGTVIGVRPTREHPDAQWINVSVKNIRPERQSFIITCQFVERPPWPALALLNG
jgi:hypothetical protein